MNHPKIRDCVRDILDAVGEDVKRDGLFDTPMRVSRMYAQLLNGYNVDVGELLRTFTHEQNGGSDAMVIEKDIPFYSLCEHHMIPFFGVAHVGYIPSDSRVAGLSKLARVVDAYAHRLQMQERLTDQIADALNENLSANVMVVIEARHLCMEMRGVQKSGTMTITSAVRGKLKESVNARSEFLALIRR